MYVLEEKIVIARNGLIVILEMLFMLYVYMQRKSMFPSKSVFEENNSNAINGSLVSR